MTRRKEFTFLVLMAILAVLLFVPMREAFAAVWIVTDPLDEQAYWLQTPGMFRTIFNNCQDGDEIRFADTAQTVYLRQDLCFTPGKTVTITGPATITTSPYHLGTSFFLIPKDATAVMKNITLSGAFRYDGSGGAVNNGGTLIMEGCTIKDGQCHGSGGAIYASEGSATTLTNCVISGNKLLNVGYSGGGIHVYKGTLAMTGCTVKNNTGALRGGGCDAGVAAGSLPLALLLILPLLTFARSGSNARKLQRDAEASPHRP